VLFVRKINYLGTKGNFTIMSVYHCYLNSELLLNIESNRNQIVERSANVKIHEYYVNDNNYTIFSISAHLTATL